MQGAYNIDSDDEEEEKPHQNSIPKSANIHIQELQKVPAANLDRNSTKSLLRKLPHLTTTCNVPSLIPPNGLLPCNGNVSQLKDKTSELLDATWKEQRNKQLLSKMLELEEPTITTKVK